MNHKNFHFIQIPDKTNDLIFLKSPKTMFLGHFWSFLSDGNSFQKTQLCHTQLHMGPQHHAKFPKKLMRKFRENLRTNGRTDERMDGSSDRPYFIGFFRPRVGVQLIALINFQLFCYKPHFQ